MDAGAHDHATDRAPTPTAWVVRFEVGTANRRAVESITTSSDGRFGTRGLVRTSTSADDVPTTVAAGVFDDDPVPSLLAGPVWTLIGLDPDEIVGETAELDLARGVLATDLATRAGPIHSEQFASIVRPGVCALQVTGPERSLDPSGPSVVAPPQVATSAVDRDGTTLTVASRRGAIAASARQRDDDHPGRRTITRVVTLTAHTGEPDPAAAAANRRDIDACGPTDLPELTAEHEAAWAARWERAAIDLPAVPELESAIRLAQFHLLSSAHRGGEAAIGARGLTGPAYRGHVFWDTDVFVLPALTGMDPPMARAVLRYRANRLDAARQRAAAEGHCGARFPWESADDGFEASPTEGRDLRGVTIPVRTGQLEEHVVADVAWAFSTYLDWTGDHRFFDGVGRAVLVETARYWQSRIEHDEDGTAHIRGVIGPDEYHEGVDDNAFTNAMAAWNLRRAARLCDDADLVPIEERRAWRDTAERLVTGFDRSAGVHEQHAGFFRLQPVLARSLGHEPPVSADALLGHDRVQQTQIIKQADVLMLHHLIPDELPPGSLDADLDRYLPLTAHGSSLSPPITAAVLARAGRLAEAVGFFTMAARFDLDDLSRTTAGGVHLATMGGLWQAFTSGFLGIRPDEHGLTIDPKLPEAWGTVTHRFVHRGARVRVRASIETFSVSADRPIDLVVSGHRHRDRREMTACRTDDHWSPR